MISGTATAASFLSRNKKWKEEDDNRDKFSIMPSMKKMNEAEEEDGKKNAASISSAEVNKAQIITTSASYGPRSPCLRCRDYWNIGCPRHRLSSKTLLGIYCDFISERYLGSYEEDIISECLINFQDALMGNLWSFQALQHGWFTAQHEYWLEEQQVPIDKNEELKQKCLLHGLPSSVYLRFPCVYRKFGRRSFFIAFDNGKYFLLWGKGDGDRPNENQNAYQFYHEYITNIGKELTKSNRFQEIPRA
jgi:hypothetical protein